MPQQTIPSEDSQIQNYSANWQHNPDSREYLQCLYETYKRKSFIPSYEFKYEISSTLQKLIEQRDSILHQLKQQSILSSTISEEQLLKYYFKKDQLKNNKFCIQVLKKSHEIFHFINSNIKKYEGTQHDKFQKQRDSDRNLDGNIENRHVQVEIDEEASNFTHELNTFSRLIKLIEDMHSLMNQYHYLSPQSDERNKSSSQFASKFYKNIFNQVCSKDIQNSKSSRIQTQTKIQNLLVKYKWPLKRNKNQKQLQKSKPSKDDKDLLQSLIHKEACQYALANFLSSISNDDSLIKYNSGLFSAFYHKINSAVGYLFMQGNESHNILEPNWMFDYIQETFIMNYHLFKEQILSEMSHQSQGSCLIYILQYSIQSLFYENIRKRLEIDLTYDQTVKQPFFYFKFIDSLHELEEKLTITFSQEVSLLENILIQFEGKKSYPLLEKNFDYQHKWIEQKIFHDFYNINYSNVDLKNIQAYNIVTNFNVLFEKLYSKFSTIYDDKLLGKINAFYQEKIRNLAAHIKTSFERIYNHSGLDKLNIILAFKRVDNEFKSGLGGFINKNIQFQNEIKRDFYDYIWSLFNVYSLEQLGPYQRKLLKAATQCETYFCRQELNESQYTETLQKSNKIQINWSKKLEELNKVYSYKDTKIKNQFFTLLQSIEFSAKGITLFLQFYEPFLKNYYSFQAYNMVKMVILMDKKQQIQYLKVHNNLLNFLLQTQLVAIRKLKIK